MKGKIGIAGLLVFASIALLAFKPVPVPSKEVLRIRAHFDSVLVELTSRDITSLGTDQRLRRGTLVRTLSSYRDRGIFPQNYDFAAPTPYFVDRKTGTLCAVAHLLESTGRRDIVDRVAAANNNVWVPQLAGDAEFERWLAQHGLTIAEAARIQIPYMGDPGNTPAPVVSQRTQLYSAAGIGLAGAASVMNLMSNRDGHGRLRNVAGLISGVASLGYGVAGFNAQTAEPRLALANITTGALSAIISGRGILRNRAMMAQRRDAERSRMALAPIAPTSSSGAGVSVNVRF
jgi:hypothetical protein